jgi:hypothetical protein
MICALHRLYKPIARTLGVLCLTSIILACSSVPKWWAIEQQWHMEPIRSAVRLNSHAVRDAQSGNLNGDKGYALYIATSAVGLSLRDADSFLETFHHHPRTTKNDHTLGHAWLLLESPVDLRESGHTGEFGVEFPTYYETFLEKMRIGDPNPISALWETKQDGKFHDGADHYIPTLVVRLSITREQHRQILAYISDYDYAQFSVIGGQCTDFVAGAARLAGVELANRVAIDLPPKIYYHGRTMGLWTDRRYRHIEIATPDILEEDLFRLIREGYAEDATKWYLQDDSES